MWDPQTPTGIPTGQLHNSQAAAGRTTSEKWRARAADAVKNLKPNCKKQFVDTKLGEHALIGPNQTLYDVLGNAASYASYYDISGLEMGLSVSETIGITLDDNPDVGSLVRGKFDGAGSTDIATTINLQRRSGAVTHFNHYVFNTSFFSEATSWQDATLVHELLHFALGLHEQIFEKLGLSAGTNITKWIQDGCI
jgi:hypothetical protein